MNIVVNIVSVIVPILLNFLNKHSDEIIGKMFAKLGNMISAKVGNNSAALIVSTNPFVVVEFDRGDGKIIKKIADSAGYVEFDEHLRSQEKITITAYGEDYITDATKVEIDNEFVTYHVLMHLKKKRKLEASS